MAVFIDSPIFGEIGMLPQLFIEGHVDAGEETVDVRVKIGSVQIGYAIPTYREKFKVDITPWILSQVNGSMTEVTPDAIGIAKLYTNYTDILVEAVVIGNTATKGLRCFTHNNTPIAFDAFLHYKKAPVSGNFFAVSVPQNQNGVDSELAIINFIGGEKTTIEIAQRRRGATLLCDKTIIESVYVPHMGRLFSPMDCNGEVIRFYSESWGCYREISVDPLKKTFAKIGDRGYLSSAKDIYLGASYGREGERSYKVLFSGTYEDLEDLLISAETKIFTYEFNYAGTWENCRVSGSVESDDYGNTTTELSIFVKKLKSTIL